MLLICLTVCRYAQGLKKSIAFSQSQSYITTDSQSVSLGVEPNLGLLTRDLFFFF
jgi:hypothetical protein